MAIAKRWPASGVVDVGRLLSKHRSGSGDEAHLDEPSHCAFEARVRGPELYPTDTSQRDVERVAGG